MKKNIKIVAVLVITMLLTGCSTVLKDKDGKVVQYTEKSVCDTCNLKCESQFNEENIVIPEGTIEESKGENQEVVENKEVTENNITEQNELEEITATKEEKVAACKNECTKKCENAKKTQTGQNLTENILCKPTDESIIELYTSNGVDLSKLPDCKKLSIATGKYEGIWTTIFVKPLAWLIVLIGNLVKNYGVSVIIITILIRLALYPITKKTALQSENMKKAAPELKRLENKYAGKADQQSQMAKSQEMMMIYKKYNINPLSGCLFSLIQIPLFFAFYEALNRLPIIFEGSLLGFNLGITPWVAIFNYQKYYYIIIVVLVGLLTYYSFKLNSTASMSEDQAKQMKIMSTFSVVLITIMSFRVSISIALYWIFNSAFTVVQNLLVKRGKKNDNII